MLGILTLETALLANFLPQFSKFEKQKLHHFTWSRFYWTWPLVFKTGYLHDIFKPNKENWLCINFLLHSLFSSSCNQHLNYENHDISSHEKVLIFSNQWRQNLSCYGFQYRHNSWINQPKFRVIWPNRKDNFSKYLTICNYCIHIMCLRQVKLT